MKDNMWFWLAVALGVWFVYSRTVGVVHAAPDLTGGLPMGPTGDWPLLHAGPRPSVTTDETYYLPGYGELSDPRVY